MARYVRTEAGAKRYGKPIGSPIGGGAASKLAGKAEGAVGKFASGSKPKDSSSARSEPSAAKPAPHTHESILAHAASLSDADLAKLHEALGAQRESRKPKPGNETKAAPAVPSEPSPKPAPPAGSGKHDVDRLKAMKSRDEANAYLSGASKADLLGVLSKLGSETGRQGDSKERLQRNAVELAVGRRLDSDAITRVGQGRPAPGAGPAASKFAAPPKKPVMVELPNRSTSNLSPRQQAKAESLIAGQQNATGATLDLARIRTAAGIDSPSDQGVSTTLERAGVMLHSGTSQKSVAAFLRARAGSHEVARQELQGEDTPEINANKSDVRILRRLADAVESAETPTKSTGAQPANPTKSAAPATGTASTAAMEQRVFAAYQHLTKEPGGYVSLADLRADPALRGIPAAAVSAELQRIGRGNFEGGHVIPVANLKSLTHADRAAAVTIGGEPSHTIRFDKDFKPAGLPAQKKATAGRAAARMRGR